MRPDQLVLLAFVLLAHAWQPRIVGDPGVLSIVGWTLNVLAIVWLIFALMRSGVAP